VLNALERIAGGYAAETVRVRQDLSIAESQLRDYQGRLGQPFPHEVYLSELTGLRDQLKAGLSAGYHEPDDQKGPSASELACRIKALKAANTIEAAPQRVQRKQAAVEEPITARIRRRQEEAAEVQHAEENSPEGHAEPGDKSPLTFQERIEQERRRKVDGEGQSPGWSVAASARVTGYLPPASNRGQDHPLPSSLFRRSDGKFAVCADRGGKAPRFVATSFVERATDLDNSIRLR